MNDGKGGSAYNGPVFKPGNVVPLWTRSWEFQELCAAQASSWQFTE